MIKILVLSSTPWSSDNSFGNSFTNIFDGIGDIKFANIYCNYGKPDNDFDMEFFQITEKSLIENLIDSTKHTGKCVYRGAEEYQEMNQTEQATFNNIRKVRWQIFYWIRDIIWKIGRWESKELNKFIDEFQPDIIFQPIYIGSYMNNIALYLKEYTGCPMLGYISDDNYTLRQMRISPFYWINRLVCRRKVKAVIEKCEILYVISGIQKEEYERIFTPPCKVLTKCADFSTDAPDWSIDREKVRMVYAGNMNSGRFKSLKLICDAVNTLNKEGIKIKLDIYSTTPYSENMKKAMCGDTITLNEAIAYGKLLEIQKNADILIHVEGMSKSSRLEVHQSFSTKLVDFFEIGKCIFAVGKGDEASIKHLIDNDAAIVAQCEDDVERLLRDLMNYPEKIAEYGKKAYLCGAKHHDKKKIQKMIKDDIERFVR